MPPPYLLLVMPLPLRVVFLAILPRYFDRIPAGAAVPAINEAPFVEVDSRVETWLPARLQQGVDGIV